jgi:hypothetical protein
MPLLKTGALAPIWDLFLQVDNEKTQKKQRWYVQWLLSAAILAQWQQPMATNLALDLHHQAMHTVSYCCTATAIKMASKVGAFFFISVLFALNPAAAGAMQRE